MKNTAPFTIKLDQAMIDTMLARLIDGKGRCMRLNSKRASGLACSYRSDDGTNSCVIGVLLPDGLADTFQGSLYSLVTAGIISAMSEKDAHLLAHLQSTHDYAANWLENGTIRGSVRDLISARIRCHGFDGYSNKDLEEAL